MHIRPPDESAPGAENTPPHHGMSRRELQALSGSEDAGTPGSLMQALAGRLPQRAAVSVYAGCGHSPFAEEADRFNAELTAFAARVLAG